jgi:hypothetical protein
MTTGPNELYCEFDHLLSELNALASGLGPGDREFNLARPTNPFSGQPRAGTAVEVKSDILGQDFALE